ncbi:hypothetical protein, variant 2 [Blastomyces gilchristii SLH14081]|uniref:Uncharacterized protein n=1 Tax=Blastomyces gilchristii (strain SLH14081) TaxID=559298 RepID=A0A179UBJ5_BLAGS|nr:hypothetical protein, variant 2 [Blastomyces gilchristii SLH14081]OAT05386.1 hypothetical protein, variant 2 [Blastomyces gilchristii SLH14081]
MTRTPKILIMMPNNNANNNINIKNTVDPEVRFHKTITIIKTITPWYQRYHGYNHNPWCQRCHGHNHNHNRQYRRQNDGNTDNDARPQCLYDARPQCLRCQATVPI